MIAGLTTAPPNLLPERSEICIVGGGIIGALTALELAELGRNVVLLERHRLGGLQSSRNLGWVRQQGRARPELPLMVEARARWFEMENRYRAAKLRFDQHGISYFGNGQDTEALYESYKCDLGFHGVEADLLSRNQITDQFPNAHKTWDVGLRTPTDGRVEPRTVVSTIADIARANGAQFVEGCDVEAIAPGVSGDTRVYTNWGEICCEKLLICAGIGSSQLLRKIGVILPQLSIESTVIELSDEEAKWYGSGSDGKIAFYRKLDGRVGLSLCEKFIHRLSLETALHAPHYLRGWRSHLSTARLGFPHGKFQEPQPSNGSVSASIELAKERGIIGKNAKIKRAWAGEIDVLPDFLPAIGGLSKSPSIAVAAGFSGHGFGLAPAVAKVLTNLLLEEKESHDLSPFRIERFSDGSSLTVGPTF